MSRSWRRLRGRADRRLPASVGDRARLFVRAFGDRPVVTMPGGDHAVVVSPHPDDESIMCGGTIARFVHRGGEVTLIAVTDGERGGDPVLDEVEAASRRRSEQQRAANALGIQRTIRLGLPDGALDKHTTALASALADHFRELAPDVVLTPWWLEAHADHEAVALAVGLAVPDATEVWAGEVWTPLVPNRLVDVTAFMDKKRAAIDCYETAAAAVDPRSLAALSRYRSAFGLGGNGNAEAFVALVAEAYRGAIAESA